ncbi:LysR substrate-binding domain-containing protein [Acinetobacter rudis]|jgi:LysR family glycine cleavage system transcriptional activator|uniref:LysR family transcriptional regulator, glycine cleavage system transcriptional activator n=1 Tax=Acinetobacter rudis CIP 110305 TaxID=421052 RepID=S3NB44_9GAMM|nr:LysR substrate-binding domain-containing protein [Acinetobacter rudis]EPF71589.1 LysR family transcriptional regulator, glycine cleavage system transcriptional activator [Acinetobacter rudis CIP 110305]
MASTLPLLALRTFVEVGQRGTMKATAEALNITSGAVSQQIRLLEDRLGFALFVRERQGLRLTEAGAKVHPTLLQAFQQIESAIQDLQQEQAKKVITISTVATFAASWLVPRLGHFNQLYPEIEVRVEATSSIVDLRRDRVDIAIRHGLGHYPDLEAIPLIAPVLVPVASPDLLDHEKIITPADCLNYPLLHDIDRADWSLWLSAHGVDRDPRVLRGSCFEDDFLLIRAAEAGQGLALVPIEYAQTEILAGRLVQVLDKPWPARFAYYIVTQPDVSEREELRLFVTWLLKQADSQFK